MKIVFAFLISSILLISPVKAANLADELNPILNDRLASAHVGIVFKDENGNTLYSYNAKKYFYPASGTKIFTAAAALYRVGPDYEYITSISKKGEDFYLTFTGSPSFTNNDLDTLVSDLKSKNINTIKGDIIIDDSMFKMPLYPAGITYDDLGLDFTAPSSAIIINNNIEPFTFKNLQKIGQHVVIQPENPDASIKVQNELTIVNKDQATNHCDFNIEIEKNNELKIYGCMEQQPTPKKMKLAVTDPFLLAQQTIIRSLKTHQIAFSGSIIRGKTPADTILVSINKSQPMQLLVKDMLENSINIYADSLTKLLGFLETGEGTYKQGVFAIKKTLQNHTSLNTNKIVLKDGVGGKYNLTTPEQFIILLQNLHQNKLFKPILFDLFPRMGVSGTLKARLSKTDLTNKIFAKTGTMTGISSLSGYMELRSKKIVYFSILINNFEGDIGDAKKIENTIVTKAYHFINNNH